MSEVDKFLDGYGKTETTKPTKAAPVSEVDELMKSAPAQKRSWGEAAGDVGAGLLQGGAGLVKSAGDLYGLASGNMDNPASELGKNAQEYWQDKKSDSLKERTQQRKENIDAQDSTLGKAWFDSPGASRVSSSVF